MGNLAWSNLKVSHARGHRHMGEGLENWKFTFFAKNIALCHILILKKTNMYFLISSGFFFRLNQWTNLRHRLCGVFPREHATANTV